MVDIYNIQGVLTKSVYIDYTYISGRHYY